MLVFGRSLESAEERVAGLLVDCSIAHTYSMGQKGLTPEIDSASSIYTHAASPHPTRIATDLLVQPEAKLWRGDRALPIGGLDSPHHLAGGSASPISVHGILL